MAYTGGADSPHPTRLSIDAVIESGLRASGMTIPNGVTLQPHAVVNLSITRKVTPRTELRLDVLNMADATYEIRDGSGVGVGAPQYGIRRTILAGVTQRF